VGTFGRVLHVLLILGWSGGGIFFSGAVIGGAAATHPGVLDTAFLALAWLMLALASQVLLAGDVARADSAEGSQERPTAWGHSAGAVLLLFSLSPAWTGAIVGGPALASQLFGSGFPEPGQAESLLVWGWTVVLGLMVLLRLPEKLRSSGVLRWEAAGEGFRLHHGVASLIEGVGRIRQAVEKFRSGAFFARVIAAPSRALARLSMATAAADRLARELIDRVARGLVEAPAKGLQLMHSGSMQAYLLFTVGFALALLLHFLGHIGR
jgi:hypothetical protein